MHTASQPTNLLLHVWCLAKKYELIINYRLVNMAGRRKYETHTHNYDISLHTSSIPNDIFLAHRQFIAYLDWHDDDFAKLLLVHVNITLLSHRCECTIMHTHTLMPDAGKLMLMQNYTIHRSTLTELVGGKSKQKVSNRNRHLFG